MQTDSGWKLWLEWVLATGLGVGILAIVFLAAMLITAVGDDSLILMLVGGVVGGVVVGAASGGLQWLVLRRHLAKEERWILANTIAWAIGLAVGWAASLQSTSLAGLAIGIVIGVAQWYVLRRHVLQAGWWIFACAFGWMIAFRLLDYSWIGLIGFVIVPGGVTGVALVWLLQQGKPAASEQPDPRLPPIAGAVGCLVLVVVVVAVVVFLVKAILLRPDKPAGLQLQAQQTANCPQGRGKYSLDSDHFRLYAQDRIDALSSAYAGDAQLNENWKRHAERVKMHADETDTETIMQLWQKIIETDGFENEYGGIGLNPYLSSEQVMAILSGSKTDANMYWLTCHLRRHPNICAPEGDAPGAGGICSYDEFELPQPTDVPVPTLSVTRTGGRPSSNGAQSDITAIDVGSDFACALRLGGSVWCWGSNYYGQLGDGTLTNSMTPVQVSGLDAVSAIDAGDFHICALRSDGTVWCWGNNPYEQVGIAVSPEQRDAWNAPVPLPVAVPDLRDVTAISVGGLSSCALRSDTTVWCWGDNRDGELGDGAVSEGRPTPGQVPGLNGVGIISVGGGSVCALDSQQTAWCWGWNAYGQIGNGTTRVQSRPVTVSGLTDIVDISQGSNQHTCAVRSDGIVWCWGWNSQGQLGDGTTIDSSTPRQVPGLSAATAVSAAGSQTCALRSDGTVWCWGDGSTVPAQVEQINDVTAVSVGGERTCALKSDGEVWCWAVDLSSPEQITGFE